MLVECNTVGTKKTSLISTDIDRTASSRALASACIYFLINSIGQKFAEICLDLEVTTECQFYKPRLILW